MDFYLPKSDFNKENILRLLVAIILVIAVILPQTAFAAFTYERVALAPDSFYTTARSSGTIRSSTVNFNLTLQPGESARIKYVIPPGVSVYNVSSSSVNKWQCIRPTDISGNFIGEGCVYDHSFSNFSNADSYGLNRSSGYDINFVGYGAGSLRVSPTTAPLTGYFVIKNDSAEPWTLSRQRIYMKIDDVNTFNSWDNIVPPVANSMAATSSTGGGSGNTGGGSGNNCSGTNGRGGFFGRPC